MHVCMDDRHAPFHTSPQDSPFPHLHHSALCCSGIKLQRSLKVIRPVLGPAESVYHIIRPKIKNVLLQNGGTLRDRSLFHLSTRLPFSTFFFSPSFHRCFYYDGANMPRRHVSHSERLLHSSPLRRDV